MSWPKKSYAKCFKLHRGTGTCQLPGVFRKEETSLLILETQCADTLCAWHDSLPSQRLASRQTQQKQPSAAKTALNVQKHKLTLFAKPFQTKNNWQSGFRKHSNPSPGLKLQQHHICHEQQKKMNLFDWIYLGIHMDICCITIYIYDTVYNRTYTIMILHSSGPHV